MNEDQNSPYEYEESSAAKPSRLKAATIAATGFLIFGGLIGGGAFAASQANQADPTPTATATATAADVETSASSTPTPDSTSLAVPPTTFTNDEGDDYQAGEQGEDQSGEQGEDHHKGDSKHDESDKYDSGSDDSNSGSDNGSDD